MVENLTDTGLRLWRKPHYRASPIQIVARALLHA